MLYLGDGTSAKAFREYTNVNQSEKKFVEMNLMI